MRVRAERVDSAWVLHLEGRLTVEEDTRQLHEMVRSMTHFDKCNVVLDFGNVGQLDCSGIGQLVQLDNQVRGSGGALTLLNVEHRQKRLLQLLGLLAVFRVVDRRQEAITGCRNVAAWAPRPSVDRVFAQAI